MNPVEFLETKDDLKRMMMQSIAARFREAQLANDRNRATMISNAVWGAVKKS